MTKIHERTYLGKRLYLSRKDVPTSLRSQNQWKKQGMRPKSDATPAAYLARRLSKPTKSPIGLYNLEQVEKKENEERRDLYWINQLEEWLSKYGATTTDLRGIDPKSCQSRKKLLIAERAQRQYLIRQIREINKEYEYAEAIEIVGQIIDKARLITDGDEWIRIDDLWHREK